MEERIQAMINWLNETFFISYPISTLDEINNTSTIYKILHEIDQEYFSNQNMLRDDINNNYEQILLEIRNYYKMNMKKELETIDYYELNKIIELIIGISAQCVNREKYLNIIENMNENDINQLMSILEERIINENEIQENETIKDHLHEDDNAWLFEKIERLEKRNAQLTEENENLNLKLNDYTKINLNLENIIKEYDMRYLDLVESSKTLHKEEMDNITLSIELSEIKGKLEAYEKLYFDLKSEKDKAIEDLKEKIEELEIENKTLKVKTSKLELMSDKLDNYVSQIKSLKQNLIQAENQIKEERDKFHSLKFYESEKTKLLSRIEELNFIIVQEREKIKDIETNKVDTFHETYDNKNNLADFDESGINDYETQIKELKSENEKILMENKEMERKIYDLLIKLENDDNLDKHALFNYID